MAKLNGIPMTGGSSKLLKFKLPPYDYVVSAEMNLYYKTKGTSGNNTIIQMGAYIDMVRRVWRPENDNTIPDETTSFYLTYPTWLDVKFDDGPNKTVFYIGKNEVEYTGSLLDWEFIREDPTASVYRYLYYATYRIWLQPVFEGTSTVPAFTPYDYPEFVVSSTATTKVTLDWNCTGIYGVNPVPSRDTQTFYLSFANAPYINSYPSEIEDTMDSFRIDYYIPDPSLTDYISFGILDKTGELLSGYKIAPKDGSSYTYLLSEQDKEVLYNTFNKENSVGLQFAVRYKNYDSDPIVVSYPMILDIVIASPTINYTAIDTDDVAVSLTGDISTVLRSVSDMQFTLDVVPHKGATIDNYYISQNNYRVSNQKTVVFKNAQSNMFTLYAKDSRGNVTAQTIYLPYVDYFPVTCNMSAEPPKTSGELPITLSGMYWNHNFGTEDNTIRFEYKYTSNITENNIGWTRVSPTPEITWENGIYNTNFKIVVPNHADTYTIQVRAIDKVGNGESSKVTVKSTPVFDWGQYDFNFNVPVTVKGDLVVAGQIIQSDSVENCEPAADYIIAQGTAQTGSDNSLANWTYRKWNSGIFECWCRKHISTAVSTAWGSLFVSGSLPHTNLIWPINFVDIPVANITIAPNASGAFLIAGGSTSLTTTTTGGYEIARGTSSSSGNYYINYYGIGRWK